MAVWMSMFTLFTIVLQFYASSAVTYTDYDIASDRVCSRLSKRELALSMSRPLVVREGGRLLSKWPGVHSFRCRWEVEAKGRGIGVVAVVQKLKFRRLGTIECTDYLQFKEEKESNMGERLCGSMLFGHPVGEFGPILPQLPSSLPPLAPTTEATALSILSTLFKGAHNPWTKVLPPGAVVDPNGELKTVVYVEGRPIRSDETLELVIAYSGFQVCDGRRPPSGLFHCGYGLCISDSLVMDGLVNCPFGDCIDERSCSSAQASNLTAQILGRQTPRSSSGVSTGVTATSSFFAIAILITIGACICFIIRRNKKRNEASEGTTYPAPSANGEYFGVPTNTGAPPADQPQAQPQMVGQQPPPGGQPIGFCVPGGPFPPVGTPYPGAGTPYPGSSVPVQYPPAAQQYPTANPPYPVQPPPTMASAPEAPPPYNSLFPQQKN